MKVKITQLCPTFCNPMDSPWNSPGRNSEVDRHSMEWRIHFILQRIFSTQGSNPGPPHCRWILCQLSHQGSPRILEWVAYPLSSGSSQHRDQARVSCTAGGFFTSLATRCTVLPCPLQQSFF